MGGQPALEGPGAVHQAVQIDRHHLVPALRLELAALVDHRALAEDQHVQGQHVLGLLGDGLAVGHVHAGIGQAAQIGALHPGIVLDRGPGAPDIDRGPALPERVGDPIADTAGAAHHQHALAGEIQFVHRTPPETAPTADAWEELAAASHAVQV